MQSDLLPSRVLGPDVPLDPTPRARRTLRRVGRIAWLGAGLASVAILAAGCTSTKAPSLGSSGGLKALNPIAAHNEEVAFKKKVEKDPFPTASQAGVASTTAKRE